MKRFFLITLLSILIAFLILIFVGCNTDTNISKNTNNSSNSNTDIPHEHSFNQIVTSPTCTNAGFTTFSCDCGTSYKDNFKDALGHTWNEATCVTPKLCSICKITEGKSNGHTYIDGECIYCFEEDIDYIILELTASKTDIYLEDTFEVIHITMTGGESLMFDINDTNIVSCEWGEWDGDTIPLTLIPLTSGETVVTISIEDYDKSIDINVFVTEHEHSFSKIIVEPKCLVGGYTINSCNCGYYYNSDHTNAKGHHEVIDPAVPATPTSTGLTEGKHCLNCGTILQAQLVTPKDYSSVADSVTLTLTNDLSQQYSYVSGSTLYTKCKIENVEYGVTAVSAERITLNIKFLIAKTVQGNTSMSNTKFRFTLFCNGIAVKTGDVTVIGAHLDTLYEKSISYSGEPGEYTITCESVWY